MRSLAAKVVFVVCALAMGSVVQAEEDSGALGFSIEVDGEGFFLNPTLKSVTIVAVASPSPAASAGIAPKDQIVEAEGHAIVGAKARDLEPLIKRKVGQAVHLRLRRPTGEEYAVTLVAVARPAKP